jgi:hypothetical protein
VKAGKVRQRGVIRFFFLFTIISYHRCIQIVPTNPLHNLVWVDVHEGCAGLVPAARGLSIRGASHWYTYLDAMRDVHALSSFRLFVS